MQLRPRQGKKKRCFVGRRRSRRLTKPFFPTPIKKEGATPQERRPLHSRDIFPIPGVHPDDIPPFDE